MQIREGNSNDLHQVKKLALDTWKEYQEVLTEENWIRLSNTLNNDETYIRLLTASYAFVCEDAEGEIYSSDQSYIRFVTVAASCAGLGLGQRLTEKCIEKARETGEQVVALHTSEFMNKARYIYEKLGFRIIRELPGILGKRYWLYELQV
jgi:ribosomal protein S18 acetylase RimI-like enzyme